MWSPKGSGLAGLFFSSFASTPVIGDIGDNVGLPVGRVGSTQTERERTMSGPLRQFTVIFCIAFLVGLQPQLPDAQASIPFPPLDPPPEEAPFRLPPGFQQELVAYQRDAEKTLNPGGMWDMLALNGDGSPHDGRFLFRAHETGFNAGISRTDVQTGITETLVENVNYGAFDPVFWTPWNTLLTAEEWSGEGRLFEVTNPLAPVPSINIVQRTAIPLVSHEGLKVDRAGNLYFVDEAIGGGLYRFVPVNPFTPGALTQGQSFVLRDVEGLDGTNTGVGQWVPITDILGNPLPEGSGVTNPFDNTVLSRPGRQSADDVGASDFSRPEDLELGTLGNGREVLYMATTSSHQVFSIELDINEADEAFVRGFADRDTTDALTNSPVAGNFAFPDNLAIDLSGNIYIVEDNDTGDIWFAEDVENDGVAERLARWATLTTPGAEPTGLLFDHNNPRVAYVNVQHPHSAIIDSNGGAIAFPTDGLGDATFRIISSLPGDLDCNGNVDFDDIAALVLGLNDPITYEASFGLQPRVKGDLDADGDFDFDDVPGFIALLSGQVGVGMQPIPEPSTLTLIVASVISLSGVVRPIFARWRAPAARRPTLGAPSPGPPLSREAAGASGS
jgi:hypothetical protein